MRRYHTLFDGRLREHRTSQDALVHLEQVMSRSHSFCSGVAETEDGHVEIRQLLDDGAFVLRREHRTGGIEPFYFPSEHELICHLRKYHLHDDRPILEADSFPHVLASIRNRFKTTRGLERAIIHYCLDGDVARMDRIPHIAEADMETSDAVQLARHT